MLHSRSGHGDADDVLESGEGGGGLTLVNSGISPSIAGVPCCKCDGNRVNVWQFCSRHLHG